MDGTTSVLDGGTTTTTTKTDTGATQQGTTDATTQQQTTQQGTTQQGTTQQGTTQQGTTDATTQQEAATWYKDLPTEMHEGLKGFAKVDDLVKAYTEAQGKIPKVPEKIEEYGLTGLPKNQIEAVGKAFQAAGLTKEQAAAVLKTQADMNQAAVQNSYKIGLEGLQKRWGDNFDKNLRMANAAIKRFVPPQLMQFWKATGEANSEYLGEMFREIASVMSEDTLAVHDNGSGTSQKSIANVLYPNQGK